MSKSLKQNSLFNIIYNVANVFFPLITSMYVSRVLLADGIGRVAYGQNIASYFVILATLGLPTYGIREIAKVREDRTLTNRLFTELLSINSVLTIIATILYLSLIWVIPKFHSDIILFLCCGIQIVLNLCNIDWFYQGQEDYVYIAIRSIIVKIFSFFLIVVFIKNKEDYIWYAFISSLAVSVNYLFNVVHARRYVKLDFSELHIKRHLVPLLVLAVSYFFSVAYSKIDVTMLGSMSSETATGLYNNAHKIIDIIIVACSSISSVFLPRLSYYYKYNYEQFLLLVEKGIKILSFVTFPVTVGIIIVAPQVVKALFGEAFIPSAFTIRIFAILILIKSFGNLLSYQLIIATGNEKKRLPACILAAIINISLNAILIPRMAQNGAAIASVISEVIVNGIQFYAMCKIIKMPFPSKAIIDGIISSSIMGLIVYLIARVDTENYFVTGVCIVSGIIIYTILNKMFKNDIYLSIENMIKSRFISKMRN